MPGTLSIVDGPNAGLKTDGPGDDQAEVSGGAVRVRLGTGATAADGGVLAPGSTTTVRFRVRLGPDSPGTTVANRASLAYVAQTVGQPFTYVGNETTTPVAVNADLQVTKSTTPDPLAAGSAATSVITVTNNGPNTAIQVVVTDTLSAGVTPSAATIQGGSCAINGQVVTCTRPTMANGATATVQVTGRVGPGSAITTYTDLASVSSDTLDPNPANDQAGASVSVVTDADLEIAKSADPTDPVPGSTVRFPITVTNNGPSNATDVRVADTLPDGLSLAGLDPRCSGGTGATVNCTIGALAAGDSETVDIVATVGASLPAGTAIVNTASGASMTPDSVDGNNSTSATITTAAPQADLAVTKTGPASAFAGGQVTYTAQVVNNGPSLAPSATFTDTLPAGAGLVNLSTTRGSCAATGCVLGDLPVGGTATITITVAYDPDAALGTSTNTAEVDSDAADPNSGNSTSDATLDLTGRADLAVTKTGTPNPAVAGQQIVDTITVVNNGPSRARGVTIADQLPAGVSFVSAVPAQGTCAAPAAGSVSCNLGELTVGDSVIVTVTLGVPDDYTGADITDTATVGSTTTDPNPDNDTASYTRSSGSLADLQVTKTAAPDQAVAGQTVTWTVSVTNQGPSAAAAVAITDTLPDGLSDVAAAGCTVGAGTVTCTVGTVAAGTTVTRTITARVAPDGAAGDTLANSVTATSTTRDPTDANNTATTSTPVHYVADLVTTKTANPTAVASGQLLTFTINVTNNGPSTARQVTLVDAFDASSAVNPGNLCRILDAADQLECDLPDIPPGQSQGFQIFEIPFDDAGEYTNTVTAATSTPESDVSNNTGAAPVTVLNPDLDLALTKAVTGEIVAGERFEYTLTVNNLGPSIAQVSTLTDTLPAGLAPDGATTDSGTCTVTGQVVECGLEFLAPPEFGGGPAVITVVGTVDPNIVGGSVINTATIDSLGENNPDDNTASVTTDIVRRADVTVVKTAALPEFVAGGGIDYAVAITNTGPSAATSAVLDDVLPAQATFAPRFSDPRCTAPATPGAQVTCDLSAVPVGDTVVVRIAAALSPAFTGDTITNSAVFRSAANEPVTSAPVTTPVVRSADLAVTKSATSQAVPAGEQAEFVITVTNNGPSVARAVQLEDLLPPGTSLVSIVTNPDSVSCTDATCEIGDLAPGTTVSATIALAVLAATPAGRLTNTAVVRSPTPDPEPATRTSTATIDVVPTADVSIEKRLVTDPVVAGAPVTYEFVVNNAGPSVATNTTISDALPAGTTFVSGSLGGTPCVASGVDGVPTVSCTLATLDVGERVTGTLTLDTAPDLGASLVNTAYVGAEAIDMADADNVSVAAASVSQPQTTPTTTPTPSTIATTPTAPTSPSASTTAPSTIGSSTTAAPTTSSTRGSGTTGLPTGSPSGPPTNTGSLPSSAPPPVAGGGGAGLAATGVAVLTLLLVGGGLLLLGGGLNRLGVTSRRRH